jgi:glycosyltransferase involved in cell wall biosynthesis
MSDSQRKNNCDVTLVVPCYNEETGLAHLAERVVKQSFSPALTWELLLIDDGSQDGTWQVIQSLARDDPRIRGIRLGRNMGQAKAILAGLSEACGRATVIMDADLQHPPELIPTMVKAWREGAPIVGTRRRSESSAKRHLSFFSRRFYVLFSRLSGMKLPEGSADFRLLDRTIVEKVLRQPPDTLFLRGFVQWLDPRAPVIEYTAPPRQGGGPKYRFSRRVAFAVDGLTSFSLVPLRIAVGLGVLVSVFSFVYLGYVLFIGIQGRDTVPGWASIAGLLSLMIGLIFLYLGILGEYVGRIFRSVRGLPPYHIIDRTDTRLDGGDRAGRES